MITESIVEAVVAESIKGFNKADEYFSKTRDVFTARLQSYIIEKKNT
jgi:hypothetical protein